MAYFTNSQGYGFLCPDIPFEETWILRFDKKIGIAFIGDDTSNSAESFGKMESGEDNLFSKRCLPRKTIWQQPLRFIPPDKGVGGQAAGTGRFAAITSAM